MVADVDDEALALVVPCPEDGDRLVEEGAADRDASLAPAGTRLLQVDPEHLGGVRAGRHAEASLPASWRRELIVSLR